MKENFFKITKILANCDIKLTDCCSTDKYQILGIVTAKDEIVFRYASVSSEIIFKKIDWFNEKKKCIQSINFDPTGCWLLVLCIDNTVSHSTHVYIRT
jgi:hypothetical protein